MKTMMVIAAATALATVGVIEGIPRAEAAPVSGVCATRAASIYFEKNGVELNSYSRQIVARMAADAKSCGRSLVFADAPNGALKTQRSAAIAGAFAANGVRVILARAASTDTSPASENVLDRAASVRVQIAPPNS